MNIFMFILFLFCNLTTVLICKFAYGNRSQYEEGMLMGVHVPPQALTHPKVRSLLEKSEKIWKPFQWSNFAAGILVCFFCFADFGIFLLIWTLWLVEYLVGLNYLILDPHKKMYQLKLENGWINEETRHLICVDTRLSAASGREACSWKWHLAVILLFLLTGYLLYKNTDFFREGELDILIYALCAAVTVILAFVHAWLLKRSNVVYSQNSEINLSVNRMAKRNWSLGLLGASILNGASWCYLASRYLSENWIGEADYILYGLFQAAAAIVFVCPVIMIRRKKLEMLKADTEPVYVDDDEYWKNGYYCNPKDTHLLVPNRLCSTNYSFNMARPAAKVICGAITAITAAVVIWITWLMVSLSNVDITMETKDTQTTFEVAGYHCTFDLSEITSVEMLEKLPEEHFVRTNGTATDEYLIGHFRSRQTGKCMMFLFRESSPVLKITLENRILFVNSEDPLETEVWYQYLSDK